ncbi:MAG: CocE/NonD family hydrolase [Clostridiales bacterium]|nr:CocE/NonD family hydrolase [Clostridiales bacterium]
MREHMVEIPAYMSKGAAARLGELSSPRHEVQVEKDRTIILRDGVRLHADVYRPSGSDGPFPALVGFSPFGKEAQALSRDRDPIQIGRVLFDQSIEVGSIDFFVRRGYVVVVPSPRGISTSEGRWTGPLSRQDQQDCYDVVEWAAAQSWSSGRVGMIGTGFAGKLQPLVAALQPPHLAAILPIEVVDDLYLDSYPGGTVSDINYPLCSYIPTIDSISEAELENSPAVLREMLRQAREQPEIATNSYYYRGLDSWPPRHYTWNVDILLHPLDGAFWRHRSLRDRAQHINVPVYAMSFYTEFGRSTAGAVNLFADPDLQVPKKLLLIDPLTEKCLPFAKVDLEALRWYDHWLKGVDTGMMEEAPVKLLVMGENRYRCEDQWPPARLVHQKWFLGAQGALAEAPPQQAEPDHLLHRPPTLVSQMPEEVPVLRYTSAPMAQDTEMTGPVEVCLYASIDVDDAHFITKLWDVDARGFRTLLSTGHLRASHRAVLPSRSKPGAPVHDHTAAQPVEPGKIYEYRMELAPICNLFKQGHAVELEFKSMDQQGYSYTETASLPLLYTSGRVAGAHPGARFVNYLIYHDVSYPSHILLPLAGEAPAGSWIGEREED